MKFIAPIILIAVAIAAFFLLAMPMFGDLSALRAEIASYNEALGNSKALENERDKLAAKYNSFRPEDLSRLTKLLPENADNIRLILEIEQLAAPYGMAVSDVKYSTPDLATGANAGSVVAQRAATKQAARNFGVMELEFTVSGTYDDFISFTKDLENNLRIVDITSVTFSSDKGPSLGAAAPSSYDYSFKIKTYWLKN